MGNTARVITEPSGLKGQATETGAKAAPTASPAASMDMFAAHHTSMSTIVFYSIVAVVLALGFGIREKEYLVAEEGLGYYLGIVGGSFMLLLLLYPLRKKAKFMRRFGAIKHWFWVHMVLGIIGPVLVLYHSNFSFGSTNSTVALTATLIVAGSGLVGRHFYNKIHYGLYGRKMDLKELKGNLEMKKDDLAVVLSYAPRLRARLLAFDDWSLKPSSSFVFSIFGFFLAGLKTVWNQMLLRIGLRRAIRITARRAGWSKSERRLRMKAAREHISDHMSMAVMVAEFNIYERLFSLWHFFHMPLFILLVLVGIVHVIAVHMY